jgi:hypothetical protein
LNTDICQAQSVLLKEKLLEFESEIKSIKNSESLILFLVNHAPTFADFDSLYSIVDKKKCPNNFSYDLVNGDSSKLDSVYTGFLQLLSKSVIVNPSKVFEGIQDLKNVETFSSMQDNFSLAYKKIKKNIRNKINLKIDSFEIREIEFSNVNLSKSLIKNNLKTWDFDGFSKTMQDDNNVKKSDFLTMVFIVDVLSKRIHDQVDLKNKSFLTKDLGGKITGKILSDYVRGAVFHDFMFVLINGRFVFFDIDVR